MAKIIPDYCGSRVDLDPFRRLAELWYTQRLDGEVLRNEAIRMGEPSLVPILEALESYCGDPRFWHSLLRELTGANPVPLKGRDDPYEIRRKWLDWGEHNGHYLRA